MSELVLLQLIMQLFVFKPEIYHLRLQFFFVNESILARATKLITQVLTLDVDCFGDVALYSTSQSQVESAAVALAAASGKARRTSAS